MVIFPSPTSLLPAQLMDAPFPADGPSKALFAFGSSFIHGDQASHFLSSFTCGNIASGGAAMTAERETRKSAGRVATTMTNTMRISPRAIRIFFSMVLVDVVMVCGLRGNYPPAIAPTISSGSAPLATSSGNLVSGGSLDRSSLQAEKR